MSPSRITRFLPAAVCLALAALLPAQGHAAVRQHRTTFMENTPFASVAVVDAPTTRKAQSKPYVLLPEQAASCISVSRRKRVFLYLNHYFPERVGDSGFFIVRITAPQGDADTMVHAFRNSGWVKLEKEEELREFAIPEGTDVRFPDLRAAYRQAPAEIAPIDRAKEINEMLGGDFHARRAGSLTVSAADTGLFRNDPGDIAKVWHYLIAFKATSFLNSNARPIFNFEPLPGIDTYEVEVASDHSFVTDTAHLTVKVGAPCERTE
ncbi:hypothetical protein H2509_12610 [Stappia sp. F7233]|uniref:Uncharacterized protein n=1 Tax=Stappia albiluteola TaxID=2758565 RepID=A0A839AFR3_9HYPH|nr:hypothetical protein [Stappia albiluteola]MBA5777965.1 hypothetical protein [Stappia albiluteola]